MLEAFIRYEVVGRSFCFCRIAQPVLIARECLGQVTLCPST